MLNKNWYGFKIDYWEWIPEAFKVNERRSLNILFHFKWLPTTQKCQISFLRPSKEDEQEEKNQSSCWLFESTFTLVPPNILPPPSPSPCFCYKLHANTFHLRRRSSTQRTTHQLDRNYLQVSRWVWWAPKIHRKRASNFCLIFIWFFFIHRSCSVYIFKCCLHVYVGFGYLLCECVCGGKHSEPRQQKMMKWGANKNILVVYVIHNGVWIDDVKKSKNTQTHKNSTYILSYKLRSILTVWRGRRRQQWSKRRHDSARGVFEGIEQRVRKKNDFSTISFVRKTP